MKQVCKTSLRCTLLLLCSSRVALSDDCQLHTFERQQLSGVYFSEGANAGDLNADGVADVVYGPYWFAGPDYKTKHEIYEPVPQDVNRYADNFFSWVYDFNGDGWKDVFVVGFPGTPAYVYENPGSDGTRTHWQKHQVFDWVSNESPRLTDIFGDERPELVCTRDGFFGFATIDWDKPLGTWTFHRISEQIAANQFGHGLGVGDVNGDGRMDLIHAGGWIEQPSSNADKSRWRSHEVAFSNAYGGAEMYAYDVDGDGDNDIITSHAAHDFGLGWYEQLREGDQVKFEHHLIMGSKASENRYGVLFSELHSVNLVDVDGDGLKDIVTGKTYWSHHRQSPMWDAGAVVYWFKLVRNEAGVDWIPFLADREAGIGRQATVVDVNDDGLFDIVVGGMKGAHVLTHSTQSVSRDAWQAAQPVALVDQNRADGNPADGKSALPSGKNVAADSKVDGIKAKSADGRVLNLDFETGSLEDWTAAGNAFADQPVKGDTVAKRRQDMHSGHMGDFWIGGFERHGDAATGTLTSEPFVASQPYGSFFANGGQQPETRVELVRKDSGEVVYTISGTNSETMRRVVVDLRAHVGKQIMIRLVDAHLGGWGHLNFDHFRLHAKPPGQVTPPTVALEADEYPHAGLPAVQAAAVMKLPEGFTVTLGAAEPDVKQPIAMALDDRGRVWIAEAYEYPVRAAGERGRDRILIFEDADGDGTLEAQKVFAEGLNLVSGLEVGFGGVWVGAAPYLMFLPDKDGDDVPDSEPEILLDGWGYQDTHETLNAFIWGPDGWLYGCHGVFTHSRVGKPGTPDEQRVPLNAAVWRYHPTQRLFEVFAHGTSNPWGVDFNDHGQSFITACVIPHLYHVVQGGRYQRQGGQHFNPYTYRDIVTIADHLHYLGEIPHGGNSKSDAAGGGHAHAGAMIYLGDRWPPKYRNQLFMNNIHGQRLNVDVLKPEGSGYVGSHGPDFLLTRDQASQILNLRYGPDGDVWMIDWYDMQACHLRESSAHDRSNGRIYKISYNGATDPPEIEDLARMSDESLAAMALHANDWHVRHSRRILQERAAQRSISEAAVSSLTGIAAAHADDTRRLRAAWALHVTNNLSNELTQHLMADESPYVRGWAIQLAMEATNNQPSAAQLEQFTTMARLDESPVVRLYLASAAQLMSPDRRWELLESLTRHSIDAQDPNLPLMYWYAAEPLADVDATRATAFAMLAGKSIPLIREFMLRRIGSSDADGSLQVLIRALGDAKDSELQLEFLRAIRAALKGQRHVEAPEVWARVSFALLESDDASVRLQATALGVVFGDAAAMQVMRSRVADAQAEVESRLTALQSLLDANDPGLVSTLQSLLKADAALSEVAIRGLAQYDDASVAPSLLAVYADLSPRQKRMALGTLCSRALSAVALLDAIERNQIPGLDLTADLVRQLQFLKNDHVNALLEKVWGTARESTADKLQMIASYTALVRSQSQADADTELGRAVFAKTCMKCHVLYGVGNKIGPDLTGSNRADLDYLLSNIVDPSAVMAKEYRATLLVTEEGRVVTGLVQAEDHKSVTIQTSDSVVIVPQDEIDERYESEQSMMPDDQLKQFNAREVRALFAYLQSKHQTPMLATSENASMIFNGRDLSGWFGREDLWSVENGELVGRTDGLDRNEWIVSDLSVADFRLTLEVKLVDNSGNSGIQFRSQAHDGEVSGYQADVGEGWWGKLYEEHGRGLLWDKSGEEYVKLDEWNAYEIIAEGRHIRTFINGQPCVDMHDPQGATRGVIAFQLHSGEKTEVRFRHVELEILDAPAAE